MPVESPAADVELLTIGDTAALLAVNERTVRRWIAAGELPVIRHGRRFVRVHREDALAVDAQRRGASK